MLTGDFRRASFPGGKKNLCSWIFRLEDQGRLATPGSHRIPFQSTLLYTRVYSKTSVNWRGNPQGRKPSDGFTIMGFLGGKGKMCFGSTFVMGEKIFPKLVSTNFPALVSRMFEVDRRPCIAQGQYSQPQCSLYRSMSGEDQRNKAKCLLATRHLWKLDIWAH